VYGYCKQRRVLFLADPEEVWIMEMIGRKVLAARGA
jgi:dipeptidase